MEGPQECFGDTELVVTELVLCQTKMEVRGGPKEIRDGNAPESEHNECYFALHEIHSPCHVVQGVEDAFPD